MVGIGGQLALPKSSQERFAPSPLHTCNFLLRKLHASRLRVNFVPPPPPRQYLKLSNCRIFLPSNCFRFASGLALKRGEEHLTVFPQDVLILSFPDCRASSYIYRQSASLVFGNLLLFLEKPRFHLRCFLIDLRFLIPQLCRDVLAFFPLPVVLSQNSTASVLVHATSPSSPHTVCFPNTCIGAERTTKDRGRLPRFVPHLPSISNVAWQLFSCNPNPPCVYR